jgi:hypothetical protein
MSVRLPRVLAEVPLLPAGALVALAAGFVLAVAEAVLALAGALLEAEVGAAAGGAAGAAGPQALAPTRPSSASVVASRDGCTRESSCPDR